MRATFLLLLGLLLVACTTPAANNTEVKKQPEAKEQLEAMKQLEAKDWAVPTLGRSPVRQTANA